MGSVSFLASLIAETASFLTSQNKKYFPMPIEGVTQGVVATSLNRGFLTTEVLCTISSPTQSE